MPLKMTIKDSGGSALKTILIAAGNKKKETKRLSKRNITSIYRQEDFNASMFITL